MAFDPNEWEIVEPSQPQQQPQFNPSDWEVVPQQQAPQQPQLTGPVQDDFWGRLKNNTVAAANAAFPFADEGAAALRSVIPGYGSYDQELAAIRSGEKDYATLHPYSSGASSLAGVLSTAPLLPSAVAARTGLAAKAGQAALEGGAYGAVQGFGSGEGGLANRANAAEDSAITGALLSPAIVGALSGAGRILGSTANRMGRSADAARMEFLGSREKDVVDSFKKGVTYLDESGNAVPAGSATEVTNKLQQDYQLLKDQGFFKGLPSDPAKALIRSNARQGALGTDINDIVQTADEVLAGKRVQFDPTAVKDQLRTISAEQATAVPREGFQDAQTLAEDLLRQSRQGASASRQTLSNLQGQYEAASSDLRAARAQYEALDSQYAQALTDAQALQGTAKAAAMRQAHATYAEPWANAQEALSSLADRESGLFKQIQRTQKALTRNVGAEAEAQGYTAELGAEARTLAEKQQALADQEAALRGGYKDAWKGFDPRFDTARGYAKDVGLANPSRGKALLSELRDVRNNWADSNRTVGDAMRFKRSAGNQPRIFGASASALEGDSAQLKRFIYGSFADSAKRGINQHLGPDAVNAFSKANREISALKNFEEGLIRQTAKASGIAGASRRLGLIDTLRAIGTTTAVGALNPTAAALYVATKGLKTIKPLAYANILEALSGVPRFASSVSEAIAPRSGLVAASLSPRKQSQEAKYKPQEKTTLRSQYTYAPPSVPRISYDPTPANSREQAGGSYQDLVRRLVPAVVQVESRGNSRAVSGAGAMGLMQLMPAMAKAYGVSDPFDPQQNIEGGTKLLADELQRFRDPALALAAYNAGSPRVLKALKRASDLNGDGRISFDEASPYLPKETRAYVAKLARIISV